MYLNQLFEGFNINLDTREDQIIVNDDEEIRVAGLQW